MIILQNGWRTLLSIYTTHCVILYKQKTSVDSRDDALKLHPVNVCMLLARRCRLHCASLQEVHNLLILSCACWLSLAVTAARNLAFCDFIPQLTCMLSTTTRLKSFSRDERLLSSGNQNPSSACCHAGHKTGLIILKLCGRGIIVTGAKVTLTVSGVKSVNTEDFTRHQGVNEEWRSSHCFTQQRKWVESSGTPSKASSCVRYSRASRNKGWDVRSQHSSMSLMLPVFLRAVLIERVIIACSRYYVNKGAQHKYT